MNSLELESGNTQRGEKRRRDSFVACEADGGNGGVFTST